MDKQQVLIVEDDQDTANFFSMVLSLVGYECETVLSGTDALTNLAASVPDLILLDMRLGYEVSGDDVLYQVRSNPRFENTQVIVITGYPRMADKVRDLVDLILIKPVDVDQLKTLADRVGKMEIEPKRLPYRDPVTKLFNKDFFDTRLDLAIERSRRRKTFLFGVVVFQHIPERHAEETIHPENSKVILRTVASRLKSHLRPTDTIARFSGWKFATLHEELAEVGDIRIIIDRMKEKLQQPYQIGRKMYYLNTYFGSAVNQGQYKGKEDLLDAIEDALEGALASREDGAFVIAE
jgi:diguanylate cyclase (GGDEF)-like protein